MPASDLSFAYTNMLMHGQSTPGTTQRPCLVDQTRPDQQDAQSPSEARASCS